MPNEVNIRITANDMTNSAFAGVMGRLAAVKKAADDAAVNRNISFGIGDILGKLAEVKAAADDAAAGDRQISFGVGNALTNIAALDAAVQGVANGGEIKFGIGDALGEIETLKAAMSGMSFGNVDVSKLGVALSALRSKLQSMGIADLADIDVQPGKIMTQLQLLKRLIQQAGISDVLDFNLNSGQLMDQLQKLGNISYDIPVNYDVGQIPKLQEEFTVPIKFDTSNIPKFGETVDLPVDLVPHNISALEQMVIDMPVNFDLGKVPKLGETVDLPVTFVPQNLAELRAVLDIPVDLVPLNLGAIEQAINLPVVLDLASIGSGAAESSLGALKDDISQVDTAIKSVVFDSKIMASSIFRNAGILTNLSIAAEDVAKAEVELGGAIGDVTDDTAALAKAVNESAESVSKFGTYVGDAAATTEGVKNDLPSTTKAILDMADSLQQGEKYAGGLGDAFFNMAPHVNVFGNYVIDQLIPAMTHFGSESAMLTNVALSGLGSALVAVGVKMGKLNDNVSLGLPMWKSTGGYWGILTGHLELFGGALTQIGVPSIIATASGLHILTDAIIEVSATLIPAIVGLGAFAAAGVDTADEVYTHFQALDKVNDELSGSMYPLTGAFGKMNEAAQPEVYVLLGEGLQVVAKNSGLLQNVALQAGKALDDLGARFTYAMNNGDGFGVFMKNSASDITGWGTLIGNIGGILGNFLKIMPGYAEIILQAADDTTQFVESLTSNNIVQAIGAVGLAMHGAILYIGILGTGFAKLASGILTTAAAGAYKLADGLSAIGISGADAAVVGFTDAAEGAAALPWGWIGIAAAGVGVLVYDLINAGDAMNAFASAVQNKITSTPIQNLGDTIKNTLATSIVDVQKATLNWYTVLGETQYYNTSITKTAAQAQAFDNATQSLANYKATVVVARQDLATYNSNMAYAAQVLGGTKAALVDLTGAGVTSAQMLTKNKQSLAEAVIEAEGYNQAIRAVSDGTGRFAAALNALSGPEQYLGDMLHSIQSITQAQDNLIQIVTSSENAFDTFGLGQATIASNFTAAAKAAGTATHSLDGVTSKVSLAGAAIGGLSQASLTLNQSFYSQVTSGQSLIDSLEQQEATTTDLTTATATISKQLLQYAGNNTAARATIVALINDALGPNTVSLQNLNTWVKNNSTSMQGLDSIVTKATLNAGNLANVLKSDLTQQFQADVLASSGATGELKKFTDAVVNGGGDTKAYESTRKQLITDLENTGESAKEAISYVDGLTDSLGKLPKSIATSIDIVAAGSGVLTASGTAAGQKISDMIDFKAAGGSIIGPGGPKADKIPIWASNGEFMMQANAVNKYGIGFMDAVNSGRYAGGGSINLGGATNWMTGVADDWAATSAENFMQKSIEGWKTVYQNANRVGVGPGSPTGAGGGGNPSANSALARAIFPQYTSDPTIWNAWNYVAMRESGWNQYADNPSSGAYGIGQALPYTKMPKAAWPSWAGGSSDPRTQILWMWDYMAQRYGGPYGAAAHEKEYNWYATGGLVEAAKKKVLAFGASTTQGYGATKGHDYVSDLIGLVGGKYDIINAGLAGNEILSSAVGLQGDKRFTGWLAGMKAAIIWEGNDDIAAGAKAGPIESGYRQMLEKAHADNMKVVGATLQPSNFPAGEEKQRLAVNQWIRSSGAFDAVADFAAVLRDPKNYDHMASWVYNKGQVHGVHPGDAGYAAIAPVAASALNKVLATSVAKTAKTTAKTLSLESEATLKNHYKEYAAGNKNAMSPFEKHLWHLLHIGDSWSQIESMYGGKPKSSSSSGSTNLDYVFNPGTGNFADAENGALIQEMFRAGGGSIVGVNSGTYDNGGWLQPGYTMAYNGTGQPEQVMGPNSGGGPMTLEVVSGGQSAFEQFMLQAIRNWVRVKGGGDVQRAFGSK